MINQHVDTFAGLPVVDWEPGSPLVAGTIPRLSLAYDEAEEGQRWVDKFAELLAEPAAAALPGLVVGPWDESTASEDSSAAVIEALVNAHDRLPRLRALFLGDIISEEAEISWIRQSDVSPLYAAYPQLEHMQIRGAEGLRLGTLRHASLRSLVLQSGGLPGAVVREVAAAELPGLEHLELWLGSADYGGDATPEDLAPILAGLRFPRLTYLGLRDSEQADTLAQLAAAAPVLVRITTLDLSLGTLSDVGAAALLDNPTIARLQKLDLHHHFCSAAMMARLQALGVDVDVSEQQQADEYRGQAYRYAAVTE